MGKYEGKDAYRDEKRDVAFAIGKESTCEIKGNSIRFSGQAFLPQLFLAYKNPAQEIKDKTDSSYIYHVLPPPLYGTLIKVDLDDKQGKGQKNKPERYNERGTYILECDHSYTFSVVALPSKPEGRKIRISTSSEKAKTSS